MSKYKAGDKVTVLLDEMDALNLNRGSEDIIWKKKQIIAHESAPEPIVRYVLIPKEDTYGFRTMDDATRMCGNIDDFNIIKTTITGNDFTVEKVG